MDLLVHNTARKDLSLRTDTDLDALKKLNDVKMDLKRQLVGASARKVLIISDLHIRFHNPDLLAETIDNNKDADAVILNGDVMDLYGVSTYVKDKFVSVYEEYLITLQFIDYLRSIFGLVVLVRGNHEWRLNRYINTRIGTQIMWAFPADILAMLATGIIPGHDGEVLDKYDFGDQVVYPGGEEPWWIRWGRALIVHPMRSVGTTGAGLRTASQFADRFFDHRMIDFDCAIFGHTHQVGEGYSKGRKLIEQGCLCVPMDYTKQGTGVYLPQQNGYAVLHQDRHGNTDFEKTRAVYLGIATATKETDLKLKPKRGKK